MINKNGSIKELERGDWHLAQMAKQIEADILESLNRLMYRPIDLRLFRAEILENLNKCYGQNLGGNVEIDLVHNSNNPGELRVKPKNLYTHLLLHGYQVPAAILGSREEWETPIGTFIFRNDEALFCPLHPIEQVEANFEVSNSLTVVNEREERIEKAKRLIKDVYSIHDCITGGYAHIVLDDGNLSDSNINFCIQLAENKEYGGHISEEGRLACLECLKFLLTLSVEDRETATGF